MGSSRCCDAAQRPPHRAAFAEKISDNPRRSGYQ
jgi:hypothetical protein